GDTPVTVWTGLPSPQLIVNVNPAAWSADDGSVAPKVNVAACPGFTCAGPATLAVGAALLTAIVVVKSVNPPSLSITRARTVRDGLSARNDAGTTAAAA